MDWSLAWQIGRELEVLDYSFLVAIGIFITFVYSYCLLQKRVEATRTEKNQEGFCCFVFISKNEPVLFVVMVDSLASRFLRCAVKVWWKAAIATEVRDWHPSISPFSLTSCPTLRVVHGWGVAPPPAVRLSASPGLRAETDDHHLSHSHSLEFLISVTRMCFFKLVAFQDCMNYPLDTLLFSLCCRTFVLLWLVRSHQYHKTIRYQVKPWSVWYLQAILFLQKIVALLHKVHVKAVQPQLECTGRNSKHEGCISVRFSFWCKNNNGF